MILFFCGRKDDGHCRLLLEAFQEMAGELGLPLAKEKTEGSETLLTFLGIELDTMQQACHLPLSKLVD